MPGIISGALGGMGEAAVGVGQTMQKGAIEQDLENLRSTNSYNKALALEKAKIDLGLAAKDTERTAETARVGAAQTGLIDQAKTDKLNQFYGDGSNLQPGDVSPEELASPDAQLTPQEQDATRTRAAIQTGDISPKDAALLNNREGVLDARMSIAQARSDAINAKTDAQYKVGMARVEAMLAKAGNGNTDFDKKIVLLRKGGATDKEIASFITDRKQPSLEDLTTRLLIADPNAGTKKAMTPEDAFNKAKTLRSLTSSLNDDGDAPDPTPAPGKKPTTTRPPLSSFQK